MALPEFSLRQLLEAGVHFGHQTQRWDPLMESYIYGSRNGIHILDLMIDLLGKVKTVTTNSSRRIVKTPVHDTTTTQIEFHSGATANLTTMTATSSTWKLHLYGSLGSAYLPNQHKLEFTKIDNITETTEFEFIDTLALELNTFAETILGETDFPVKISQALAGVSAMEAIAKSAESGVRIEPDPNF